MTPEGKEGQRAVLDAAARVLAPPLVRASDGSAEILRGIYRGHAAQVSASRPEPEPSSPNMTLTVTVSIDAPTYGVILHVYSRAARTIHLGAAPPGPSETLVWNEAFRASFTVAGAPFPVLRSWLDPALQAALLEGGMSFISCEGECLELGVSSAIAGNPAALDAALSVTADLMSRLPTAIATAGAGDYLERGSLAGHPAVVAYRRDERRRVLKATCLILALLAFVGGLIAAIVAMLKLLA